MQLTMKASEVQRLEQFGASLQTTLTDHQAQAAQQRETQDKL